MRRLRSVPVRPAVMTALAVRMRAMLRARVLPALHEIRRIAEDLEPGHRVSERRPIGQRADDARRQVRIGEPRQRLHELPEPVEILP